MKVRNFKLGVVIAGFALASAAPALAQNPKVGDPGGGGSGARSNPGSSGGGESAVSRGGGGAAGGATTSAGGGETTTSGGNTTSGANSPSANFGSFGGTREAAPAHRFSDRSGARLSDGQKATPRTASGGSSAGSGSSGTAVPRGSAAAPSGSSGGTNSSNGNSGARTRTAADNSNNASGAREVPSWSRPRGDQPVTGSAVTRTGPPPHDGHYGGGYYYYNPYYYYGGSYGYGYGYGYPYYAPYGFGIGYGLYSGLGWNPYYGDPFGDPYGGYGYGGDSGGYGGYSSSQYSQDQGNLKLKVKPRDAKVYVDGYLVGSVDSFDGMFQKLALNGGRHKVEVKADGYETAEFDVLITPNQTVTFQGELKRIQ